MRRPCLFGHPMLYLRHTHTKRRVASTLAATRAATSRPTRLATTVMYWYIPMAGKTWRLHNRVRHTTHGRTAAAAALCITRGGFHCTTCNFNVQTTMHGVTRTRPRAHTASISCWQVPLHAHTTYHGRVDTIQGRAVLARDSRSACWIFFMEVTVVKTVCTGRTKA